MRKPSPIPVAKLTTLFVCILSITSCQQERLDRSDVPEEIRQYDEIFMEDETDCVAEIRYGEVFIEFKNLNRDIILDELLNTSQQYAGKDFNRESVGGKELANWINKRVLPNKIQDAKFENGALDYALTGPGKLMKNRGTSTIFQMKDYRFSYRLEICPQAVIPHPGDSLPTHSVTLTNLDSIVSETTTKNRGKTVTNTHSRVQTTTYSLHYAIHTFAANICFKMRMYDRKEKNTFRAMTGNPDRVHQMEDYTLILQDTIRVHQLHY